MQDFEKLGAFYLGRRHELSSKTTTQELLLYDAKDLTTHAVCVGMTGSGKTGLCLSLLEEAAIDGIPAIAVDPKGDLGNLLLTFPKLAPEDFLPWVEHAEAVRHGVSVEQYSADVAKQWKDGLAKWGQDGSRVERFRNAADVTIYTPGSNAGVPLTVMRSFAVPPAEMMSDSDALRERVSASVSSLLALVGLDPDPIRSREHILLSNLLERSWRNGRDADLASIIREVQSPPFESIGVLELDTFFPSKDRFTLAMTLNNLLASPTFTAWREGAPLDIKQLLYTAQGKPRLSIISIAHLSDSERMFFVTLLLNELLAWVRTQSGTTSLRALFYMDEVFGYFPPTANPPSKLPMLTLLKQARAFGLGIVLATQNPVDLDYKGLSNTGTWFLGRLQTERDKARVLDGLEGASATAGAAFDRGEMDTALSALGKRVFLMNNVHEDEPVVFETRWALSYLRGPLTRQQIQTLMESRRAALPTPPKSNAGEEAGSKGAASAPPNRPLVPNEANETYLAVVSTGGMEGLIYRPALSATAKLHFVKANYAVDVWNPITLLQPIGESLSVNVWEDARCIDPDSLDFDEAPIEGATFAALPAPLTSPGSYARWGKSLKDHLYQCQVLSLWRSTELKKLSQPGESEADFRIRLSQTAHEKRDLEVEQLRKAFRPKLASLKDRLMRAQQRVEKERAQSRSTALASAVSFGSTVLSAFLGRKLVSKENITRAGSAIKSAARTADQMGDVGHAQETVEEIERKIGELEAEFEAEVKTLEQPMSGDSIELEALEIRPRKADTVVERVSLIWTPWRRDASGQLVAAFREPDEHE